jgi:hypothetical protein
MSGEIDFGVANLFILLSCLVGFCYGLLNLWMVIIYQFIKNIR